MDPPANVQEIVVQTTAELLNREAVLGNQAELFPRMGQAEGARWRTTRRLIYETLAARGCFTQKAMPDEPVYFRAGFRGMGGDRSQMDTGRDPNMEQVRADAIDWLPKAIPGQMNWTSLSIISEENAKQNVCTPYHVCAACGRKVRQTYVHTPADCWATQQGSTAIHVYGPLPSMVPGSPAR